MITAMAAAATEAVTTPVMSADQQFIIAIVTLVVGLISGIISTFAVIYASKARTEVGVNTAETRAGFVKIEKSVQDQKAETTIARADVKATLKNVQNRTDESRSAVKETLNLIQEKANAADEKSITMLRSVHALVNSSMRKELAENALLARRIAELTDDPADMAVANKAQQSLIEHDRGQRLATAIDKAGV